ncbi:hypothetical protein [Mycolicibacterium sp.]|uniref:hypothetical protein n=1 Tax=Mycolicibacterium sp. TaxID=2320850 RepID=UPI0037C5AD39
MSWLLVALIPGLLMLAAFGLDRLEAWLARESGPVSGPAAQPSRADTRETMDGLQRRLRQRHVAIETALGDLNVERLPTRLQTSCHPNPEFQETRYANRV